MVVKVKVKIPSTKKRKLAAVIHDSTGMKAKKLALLLPGFLDSKDYAHLVRLGDDLASEGFISVRFDPTGTWESEGETVFYTTSQYLRDIQAVVDFMMGKAAFEKIAIVGHSLGGRMGILYGAAEKSVSAVVDIMGSASFVSLKTFEDSVIKWGRERIKVSVRDLPNNKDEKREFRVPYSFVADAINYDALSVVRKVHKPLLMIAGEEDELVSIEEMRELFEKASKPKEFVIIKGVGHNYRFQDNEIAVVNGQVMDFLRTYL